MPKTDKITYEGVVEKNGELRCEKCDKNAFDAMWHIVKDGWCQSHYKCGICGNAVDILAYDPKGSKM